MQGSDNFTFNGTAGFSASGNGEIRFDNGFVQIDANGDGLADLIIQIDGVTSMANTDFLI